MIFANGWKTAAKATTTAVALALTAAPMTMIAAPAAHAQATEEFTGEKIDAFAVALLEVSKVREKYNAVLQRAQDEEQQRAIIEQGNAEILGAIENTDGVSVDEYRAIATAAQEDPDLNERIMARVETLEPGVTE